MRHLKLASMLHNKKTPRLPAEKRLLNCEVKPSRYGDGYKLMLKSGSCITESPKKIDVSTIVADAEPEVSEITLVWIPEAQFFKKVIVKVKVVKVKEAIY